MSSKETSFQSLLGGFGKVYFPKDIQKTCDDLVGLEEEKEFLDVFYKIVKNIGKYKNLPIEIKLSALLEGVPGTGKTTLVKAKAKEYGIPILVVFSSRLISSLLGESTKKISRLMQLCQEYVIKEKSPMVIFFDEIDSIASERSSENEVGEIKRVVISYLQDLDYLLSQRLPIGVIGATNHAQVLDSAVWRRFTFKFKFKFPDKEMRKEIFKMFVEKFKDSEINMDIDINQLDSKDKPFADGFTGSDIERAFEIALMKCIASKQTTIDTSLFESAMKFVEGTKSHTYEISECDGLEKKEPKISRETIESVVKEILKKDLNDGKKIAKIKSLIQNLNSNTDVETKLVNIIKGNYTPNKKIEMLIRQLDLTTTPNITEKYI
ncbi:MAG: AAA family ATPase [Promethearchaeota archaeon]